MSIAATRWAYTVECRCASEKAVLVALADCHNGKTGRCDPGVEYLGGRVGLGERQVRRHLDALADRGIISREQKHINGRRAGYRYTLAGALHDRTSTTGREASTTGHPRPVDDRTSTTGLIDEPEVLNRERERPPANIIIGHQWFPSPEAHARVRAAGYSERQIAAETRQFRPWAVEHHRHRHRDAEGADAAWEGWMYRADADQLALDDRPMMPDHAAVADAIRSAPMTAEERRAGKALAREAAAALRDRRTIAT